jgi:hypothetical protein
MSKKDSMSLLVMERKWLIQRFIEQKQKENDAMESERRKAKARAKR